VELTLSPDGQRAAERIAGIEEELYQSIDAAGAGHPVGEVIAYLRELVAGQPAGLALERRAGRLAADARLFPSPPATVEPP
jgi:hypothetical protein